MFISPALFVFFVITLVILAIGLLFVVDSYARFLHQIRTIENENKILKRSADARSVKALAKVQEQTEEIIKQANTKATDLLTEAKLFSADEKDLMQHKLSHIVSGQVEAFGKINELLNTEYQSALQDTKNEAVKLFKNTSETITDAANKEIDAFKTILEEQTVSSQKIVSSKIEQAYEQVEKEVSEYKKNKFDEIDQAASQRMHTIANYVLSNGLTIDQQELLIKSALQELKKQSG